MQGLDLGCGKLLRAGVKNTLCIIGTQPSRVFTSGAPENSRNPVNQNKEFGTAFCHEKLRRKLGTARSGYVVNVHNAEKKHVRYCGLSPSQVINEKGSLSFVWKPYHSGKQELRSGLPPLLASCASVCT